jgi:hypothetical protein
LPKISVPIYQATRRYLTIDRYLYRPRRIEKWNWSEMHFESFNSLSSFWGVSTVNTHYLIYIPGQFNDSINIQIAHTATT